MQLRVAVWLVCVCFIATAKVHGESFSGITVFGDSRSDGGNVYAKFRAPTSPPYFEGRFSNGPVWVEHFAELSNVEVPLASELGGTNFSWGGATTGSIPAGFSVDNMDTQVTNYLAETTPQASDLFIFVGGGNDFSQGQSNISAPVDFMAEQIQELVDAGGRQFLVANMPHGVNSTTNQFWANADEFNASLARALATLRRDNGVTIHELDVASFVDSLIANRESFGFSHISEPACLDCGLGGGGVRIATNPGEHLLWDDGHFSARTHELIAGAAYNLVAVPEPNTCTLAVFTMIAIVFRRKRRA